MDRHRKTRWFVVLASAGVWYAVLAPGGAWAAEAPDDLFERAVRPLFEKHCWECHGPLKQEAGLRLDSQAALLKGGDHGPVLAPGDSAGSRLVAALRYEGEVQMPPPGQLQSDEVAAVARWVEAGAPWPESPSAPTGPAPFSEAYYDQVVAQHWAFRPPEMAPLPAVADVAWPRSEIDHFILAELEAHGLRASPAVDRRRWLRRVTFDLHGLPPSAEELAQYLADSTPDADARVVDRLLASPRYGQRWGRHWLDVARYADTKGYVFTQDPRYPYSYTYRDYVVRSFNNDLPLDRFLLEQLAADQLDLGDDRRPLAALGFLTLGRRFMNNTHDIIDDRIDVVGRGLLGLTIGCARCHDHKYDPIPTADYYSLYGVFASSVEPDDLPIIAPVAQSEAYAEHQRELAARRAALEEFMARQVAHLRAELIEQAPRYLAAAALAADGAPGDFTMISFDPGDLRPPVVDRWRQFIRDQGPNHPVFGPWNRLLAQPPATWPEVLCTLAGGAGSDAASLVAFDPRIVAHLTATPPTTAEQVGQCYGAAFAEIGEHWRAMQQAAVWAAAAGRKASPPAALPQASDDSLRQLLLAADCPTQVSPEQASAVFDRATSLEHGKLRRAVGEHEAASPAAPPRAMALVDAPTPADPHVFLRGSPHRPGPAVPRQFLRVLTGASRQPFTQGSGRLELAEAIATSTNPLTARVLVNRIWQHHFGRGLVATPSDFGTRGEAPSHPALLDYLAVRLVRDGWSQKRMHRLLLLSSTYAQDSASWPEAEAIDPENRWWWRMPRMRLEFEALRDAVLATSGLLDDSLEGKSAPLFGGPPHVRRTIYGWIDRQDLPGVFRVFDFASPDSSTPQRPQTVVPQQALFLMNSEFVLEQSRQLAERVAAQGEPAERVAALYGRVLGRPPAPEEQALALRYVAQAALQLGPGAKPPAGPWARLAQALLMTNEFAVVD